MNEDEDKLRALPLTKPSAELDARMDRLFASTAGGAPKDRGIRLRYAFAASVLSAAAGAAAVLLAMPKPVPAPVRYVYIERSAFPARSNPFDFSRPPVPSAALWGSPGETAITYPNLPTSVGTPQPQIPSNV